jgi:hypothetical protein
MTHLRVVSHLEHAYRTLMAAHPEWAAMKQRLRWGLTTRGQLWISWIASTYRREDAVPLHVSDAISRAFPANGIGDVEVRDKAFNAVNIVLREPGARLAR